MDLFAVWSPASVLAAIAGGIVVGWTVSILVATNYLGVVHVSPGVISIATGLLAAWAGLVFYVGQLADAILSGDPGLPRIVSRFLIWLMFSASIGIGLWIPLDRQARPR